jgi:hypothetical protein
MQAFVDEARASGIANKTIDQISDETLARFDRQRQN